jgi:colicin import membrane protein
MNHVNRIAALALLLCAATAHGALPPPTPAQQEAAAAKKAAADAQAAKDKALLAASMDAITARWRGRAAQQGWKAHAPVAVAAAAPAALGGAAAPAGQPEGKLTPAGAAAPIRSEKLGTAPPSADVKIGQTKAEPAGTKPTVQKGTPKVHNQGRWDPCRSPC